MTNSIASALFRGALRGFYRAGIMGLQRCPQCWTPKTPDAFVSDRGPWTSTQCRACRIHYRGWGRLTNAQRLARIRRRSAAVHKGPRRVVLTADRPLQEGRVKEGFMNATETAMSSIDPCADPRCTLCTRPIPPEDPDTPDEYAFACAWTVPPGAHRFVLSRTTPHVLSHLGLSSRGGPLVLTSARLRGFDLLTTGLPFQAYLPLPFHLEFDRPIVFAITNDGPAPVHLSVSFNLARFAPSGRA